MDYDIDRCREAVFLLKNVEPGELNMGWMRRARLNVVIDALMVAEVTLEDIAAMRERPRDFDEEYGKVGWKWKLDQAVTSRVSTLRERMRQRGVSEIAS